MTPAHHALTVPDVVREIISKLAEEDNKQDLFSAAQCCKAFTNPSLDMLWRNMTSIVPLLNLVPGFRQNQDSVVKFPMKM
jgi:hypothetical protein